MRTVTVDRPAAGRRKAGVSKAAPVGKETEGSSNGAERYRSSRQRCGTLTKKF
jgi:hypothetical protein